MRRSTRVSISLRSVPKSIGLVSSASAPFSKALRFVSASVHSWPRLVLRQTPQAAQYAHQRA